LWAAKAVGQIESQLSAVKVFGQIEICLWAVKAFGLIDSQLSALIVALDGLTKKRVRDSELGFK
jgi:hypothetical protein